MGTSNTHILLSLIQIFILCWLCFMAKVEGLNKKVSGFYVFGDSTVDPGNNNFIKTLFRSNFPPYGMDFPHQVPTGRFTNGKLATDYIASYLGLKKELLPPYLDPNLSNIEELVTGVSFASAGSGFDPITPSITNAIPMPKQLEYFRECKKRVEEAMGKQRTENHMKKAAFFISAGTNDFVLNYFTLPMRRRSYTILAYQQFLIQHVKDFIQDLLSEGARKIAIGGLPPMGCLPVMITVNSPNAFLKRDCIDKYSSIARDFNQLLQHELQVVQLELNLSNPGAKIYYIDIYGPLADMIQAHKRYGFDEVDSGCCGSGYIEASILCNKISDVCPDPSKYVFWDSIHPTEKAYHNLFLANLPTIDFIANN
ncbi:GDSL esterase/lipase At5g45960-like [Gastrolobium bilobum]|uniref:GDSL esterase/lipase At5g45960-like n=1 Tax=Gastrolobium bilobum TaxID=150636 RepID=UPI002AB17645|nr:GDSL esterase/lipase At5g45960-like [Gastrolobium bilobum]